MKHKNELIKQTSKVDLTVPGTAKPLSHLVHSMNRDAIIKSIIDKMYYKSLVIKVIDMANFEGS